jgi:hypothetical protein
MGCVSGVLVGGCFRGGESVTKTALLGVVGKKRREKGKPKPEEKGCRVSEAGGRMNDGGGGFGGRYTQDSPARATQDVSSVDGGPGLVAGQEKQGQEKMMGNDTAVRRCG